MAHQDAPSEASVRVLVVDDQRLMREGIASLLSIQPGITVVGMATDGEDAIAKALNLRPDVILMDVRMPGMDGVAATAEVHRQLPGCQILMLTTFDDEEYIIAALRAGASGYLLKDIPAHDLAQAVQAAHRRIYQLDPHVASKLVAALRTPGDARAVTPSPAPTAEAAPVDLSERELDVVRLVARGANNREIAKVLVLSEGTVKNHISNILSRLGLRDRTQVAIFARDHKLLE
jgi:DNA-binding NarL/FixJ family response regulator